MDKTEQSSVTKTKSLSELNATEEYAAPQLVPVGKTATLLQRRPDGAEVDRGAKKPVIAARPAKRKKKSK
jgi:hypothetical protein